MAVITDQRLHVITRVACNQETALQPVITGEIGNRALQDEPVITCNRPVVIGPLDMSAGDGSENPVSVTSIESTYGTPVSIPSAQIDEQRSVEEHRCPACGSDLVTLTLLARGEWECWEKECLAVWVVGP